MSDQGIRDDHAFIVRLDPPAGTGPRLAVKDAIDIAGLPTTAGCKAVADAAQPATADAPVVAAARTAGARIVGKANLHELCFGGTGTNDWYGTPVNPLDPSRIPGGSSSGSAVAVATDQADLAFGTDTAGSVRTPSACCGTVGLKTTFGRVSLEGVWPLAPTLDTVGPMARDVGGVIEAMALLEPGFVVAPSPATVVGRLRVDGADAEIDDAVDRLLTACELDVVDVTVAGWSEAQAAGILVLYAEAWLTNHGIYEVARDGIGPAVTARLEEGRGYSREQLDSARAVRVPFRAALAEVFERVQVLALPTLGGLPPRLDAPDPNTRAFNAPINLAGIPALALPAPIRGSHLPASIQLTGPLDSEALLCATGLVVEAAARTLS